MLHLLLGRDWTANRDAVFSRISEDVKMERPGRILMVPELISHETERTLCSRAGDTASRFAEVLSFTRLARRVAESVGSANVQCLDGGGRVVAMAASARQLASRLKAYASVETKPEFLEKLIEAVDEFKRCCISPEDLLHASEMTEGSLAQKLEELSLLMGGYDALCARGKRDPRDQMTWLLERLEEGSFAQNHVFYIEGFPDFTRQHFAILECLIRLSPSVTVSINCDAPGSRLLAFEKAGDTASQLLRCARQAGVEVIVETIHERSDPLVPLRSNLFQGPIREGILREHLSTVCAGSVWQECLSAGHRVRSLVMEGCRYRDITLVVTDMAAYQPVLEQVFERLHIPLYRSGTEDIMQKNVICTVLTALDAAVSGFDRKCVLEYLRSALSPLDQDTCDLVENYAVVWNIRGNQWLSDWAFHPDGLSAVWDEPSQLRLQALNKARALAITPLEHLRQGLQGASSLREQVLALYAFLEEIGLETRLEALSQVLEAEGDDRNAQILGQLWEILLSALEQLFDVLGDTHWETEHFTRLLRLLLSQYDVGTIPPVLDAVQMGPVSAMRCHREKHLLVLGAEEGKLPGYSGSVGLLTDQERVTLRALGVPLTGGAMEGIQAEFAEIYGVFCGAEETVQVFCSSQQPSFLFRRLESLAGGSKQADTAMEFSLADPGEAAAWLAARNAVQTAGELGLSRDYQSIRRRATHSLGTVSADGIRGLYGQSLNLSASQIDTQAECRLQYFLKYGLRARERKEAAVDPAEFGTYVHAVLENTARCIRDMGGFHKVSLEQTLSIAHDFSDSYARDHFGPLASQRVQYLFHRNLRELDMVVEELWTELSQSAFSPRDFEVNFGGEDGLPAIPIPNERIRAILRGFVDRVDVWDSGNTSYYRVVDYKTGKKDFDYCDVFNGVGLQMLLYLFALKHSGSDILGQSPVPAGVQYFPARAPYLSLDGKPEPEEADRERLDKWKRKGLILNDEAVLRAMEPGDNPNRSYKVKKDGTIQGDLADRDQLKLLEGYVFRVLKGLVEDIAAGNVEPNPYSRGTSHDACQFCPYGGVCHKAEVPGRRNYKTMTAQRFWDEIGKEMGKDAE